MTSRKPNKKALQRHAEMLFDLERTVPLLRAIQKKVRSGDIVVDLGCGLGLLSIAAVHAGAKRVYAIDVDEEAIAFGKWQARQLGMEKKICWLVDYSYNIDLIEKADVLIQETIGPLAFDENFLPTLLDAKKRFLKKSAKIIPEAVSLYGARATRDKKLLEKPLPLIALQTKTTNLTEIKIKKQWKSDKKSAGILVWPQVVWAKGLKTDCSPLKPLTHWRQSFFPSNQKVSPCLPAGRDTFWLKITPSPTDPWHLSEVLWKMTSNY